MEERVPPTIESPFLRNLAGSLVAGLSAGYLSHVPHNLSTLKLMQPHRGYKELFLEYAEASRARVPANVPAARRNAATYALACIFPKGLVVRTAQIAGSFIILNGFINLLKDFDSGGMWDGVKRPFTKMIPQKVDGQVEQIMGAGMHDGSGVSGEMGKTQLAQRLLTARAGGDSGGSSSGSAGSGSSGPGSGSSSAGGSGLSGDSSSLMFAAANARNGGGSGIMRHDSSNKSLSGGGSGGSDGAGSGSDGPSSAPPPGGAVKATSAALPFWQRTLRGWVVGQPHHMAAARQQQVQLQQQRRQHQQQQQHQHRTVASAAAASRAGRSLGGWGQVAGAAPRQLPRSGPLLHASAFWHGAAARPSLNAGFVAQHAMAKQPRSLSR
jgi:hypothetical protein